MKKYLYISLFAVSLLYCQEERVTEVGNQRVDNSGVQEEIDSFNQAQGPDFFARHFKLWSEREDIPDEDRQKYAQLAQQAASQVASYRQRLNGMCVRCAQSK